MFEVSCETSFRAAHRLTRAGQPLEPAHVHDWRIEVVVSAESLDEAGVAVDFEALKSALANVAQRFHAGDIGAHTDFSGQSPSAEAVARYFFVEVRRLLGRTSASLRRVRVWEAPGCSASYAEG